MYVLKYAVKAVNTVDQKKLRSDRSSNMTSPRGEPVIGGPVSGSDELTVDSSLNMH